MIDADNQVERNFTSSPGEVSPWSSNDQLVPIDSNLEAMTDADNQVERNFTSSPGEPLESQ